MWPSRSERMPYGGSVNQIVPSRLTTTSLGELRRPPAWRSTSPTRLPSSSVRAMRRLPCSQWTMRPSRSSVLPLVKSFGARTTRSPCVSLHWRARSLGISLYWRACSWGIQTGPSTQVPPPASRTSADAGSMSDVSAGSTTRTTDRSASPTAGMGVVIDVSPDPTGQRGDQAATSGPQPSMGPPSVSSSVSSGSAPKPMSARRQTSGSKPFRASNAYAR